MQYFSNVLVLYLWHKEKPSCCSSREDHWLTFMHECMRKRLYGAFYEDIITAECQRNPKRSQKAHVSKAKL